MKKFIKIDGVIEFDSEIDKELHSLFVDALIDLVERNNGEIHLCSKVCSEEELE